MAFSLRYIVLIFGCLFVLGGQTLHAFRDGEATSEGESHFEFSTGMSLGINGFKTFHTLQMVDENGFEYDTFSLLRESSIVEAADISDQQLAEMFEYKQAVMNQISAGFVAIPDTDELKDRLRQDFLAAEVEARSVSPEQQERFEQAKMQFGIDNHGLPGYLSQHGDDYGIQLDETTVSALSKAEINSRS